MPKRITRVQPPLEFLEPRFVPWVFNTVRLLSGLYLKLGLKVDGVSVTGSERLLETYRDFDEARSRLILAFRHPHVDDGPLVFYLTAKLLPRIASRAGVALGRPVHAHFVYGRNVPVWSGGITAFLFPRVAGLAVQKGKYDSKTIGMLRQYMAGSRFPLAIAPEAQVTYHNEKVGTLDPGVSQLAFWCMEDLAKAGRPEDVRILPVTTRYRYRRGDVKKLDRLLRGVENDLGITAGEETAAMRGAAAVRPAFSADDLRGFYLRMEAILDRLLARMEAFYSRFTRLSHGGPGTRQERIDRIVDAALRTAERFFGLDSRGETLQRVLAVRQKGLAWIFRDDIPSRKALPKLERALADRTAAESFLMLQHMELADVLEYFRWDYLSPGSSWDRYVETALNLQDIASRLEGGNIGNRASVFRKRIEVKIGTPLSVVDYLSRYSANRRQAVSTMMDDLFDEFTRLSTAEKESGNVHREKAQHEQT